MNSTTLMILRWIKNYRCKERYSFANTRNLLFLGLFIGSFLQVNGQTQQKIDSIKSIIAKTQNDTLKASEYLALSNLTLYNKPEEAIGYIDEALQLYKKQQALKGLATGYVKKATYFYVTSSKDSIQYYLQKSSDTYLAAGDTAKAAIPKYNMAVMELAAGNSQKCLDIIDAIIPVFVKARDSANLGDSYMVKGKVAIFKGYYNIALQETYRGLNIHENIKDKVGVAEDLFQIGTLQSDLDKPEKAIEIYKKSAELYEQLNYKQPRAQVLAYLGLSYIQLQRYDEAKKIFYEALEISNEIDYKTNIARIYVSLGSLAYETENYDQSVQQLQKGVNLWSTLKDPLNQADAALRLGKTYLAQKQYTKARNHFDQTLRIADSIEAGQILERAYRNRAILFKKIGNSNDAFSDLENSNRINESLAAENQIKVIEELNIQYQTEKNLQEIDSQKKAIKILEQESKIKNLYYVIFGIIVLLMGLIFSFLIYRTKKRNRKRLRIAQQEVEKKEVEKLKAKLALANRESELKKILIESSITEEVLNKTLDDIKEIITKQDITQRDKELRSLSTSLLAEKSNQRAVASLQEHIDEVSIDFKVHLDKKYPMLKFKEKELLYLMKAGLNTAEMSKLLKTSVASVKSKRYRMRKKLNLGSDIDIVAHLENEMVR